MSTRQPAPSVRPVRARVNPILCQGYGICAEILPELFHRDEWGYAQAHARNVEADERPALDRAVAECPVKAIRLIEPSEDAPPRPDGARRPDTER